MGFHGLPMGVSEGVSEGFPGVSRGFRDKVSLERFHRTYGFYQPESKKTGVSKRNRVTLL